LALVLLRARKEQLYLHMSHVVLFRFLLLIWPDMEYPFLTLPESPLLLHFFFFWTKNSGEGGKSVLSSVRRSSTLHTFHFCFSTFSASGAGRAECESRLPRNSVSRQHGWEEGGRRGGRPWFVWVVLFLYVLDQINPISSVPLSRRSIPFILITSIAWLPERHENANVLFSKEKRREGIITYPITTLFSPLSPSTLHPPSYPVLSP
jgi:hypothetical protein